MLENLVALLFDLLNVVVREEVLLSTLFTDFSKSTVYLFIVSWSCPPVFYHSFNMPYSLILTKKIFYSILIRDAPMYRPIIGIFFQLLANGRLFKNTI